MNIVERQMDRLEARVGAATPVVLRITLGLLWLANIHWKRPNDFGKSDNSGLYKYVDPANSSAPVFRPYNWLVDKAVIPNFTLFGWVTLLLEITLAAGLLAGWKVRWLALLGAVQATAIGLSVVNYTAVYEWPWSYILMVFAHVGLFGVVAARRFGADTLDHRNATRGALAAGVVGGVLGLWALAKVGWDDAASFGGEVGTLLGNEWAELKFMRVNGIGALVLVAVGALGLAAWRLGRRELCLAGGALAALAALIGLLQWRRPVRAGDDGGLLGVEGGAIAVFVALALVLGTAAQRWAAADRSAVDE
jgi:hypothetical protein